MIEKKGQKYQRKFGDRQVIELVGATEDHLMITDYNGVHFVTPEQLKTHFDRFEGQATYARPKSTTLYGFETEPTKIKRDHISGASLKSYQIQAIARTRRKTEKIEINFIEGTGKC